jgi:3'(2'), 5'-bisphosphate nucleotidase
MNDALLAATLAEGAGAILLQLRATNLPEKELGEVGDKRAHRFIAAGLEMHRPEDGFISEESSCGPERLFKKRVWIVDPLDGTREYAEGREDWAVHVALAIDGEAAVGAVALPARGQLFSSATEHAQHPARDKLRIVVSRTRPPPEAEKVAQLLGAELIPMGSCGAKAMAVLDGEAEIYLHSGGQYEWDSCAPVAVALSAGFHCSRLDGRPLLYNRKDLYVADLLICRPKLFKTVLKALSA